MDGITTTIAKRQGATSSVVPAKTNMTVVADVRSPAVAGEDITGGRRVHSVRHGQGKTAWSERLEIEVRGLTGLMTKKSAQPWSLKYPPQKTEQAVRGHVIFTLVLFVLATAYRLLGEREATGGEPVGCQCWRRQLLE
jgi:hypothetical protein